MFPRWEKRLARIFETPGTSSSSPSSHPASSPLPGSCSCACLPPPCSGSPSSWPSSSWLPPPPTVDSGLQLPSPPLIRAYQETSYRFLPWICLNSLMLEPFSSRCSDRSTGRPTSLKISLLYETPGCSSQSSLLVSSLLSCSSSSS